MVAQAARERQQVLLVDLLVVRLLGEVRLRGSRKDPAARGLRRFELRRAAEAGGGDHHGHLVLPPFELVCTCGSGKFATPWLRMQAEYLYADRGNVLRRAVAGGRGRAVVVVVGELPPHPAASSATAAIAAVAGMARRMEYMITASCDRITLAATVVDDRVVTAPSRRL